MLEAQLQVQSLRRTTQFLECKSHRKVGTHCANTAYGARRRRLVIRGHTTVRNPPLQSQWELGQKGIRIWHQEKVRVWISANYKPPLLEKFFRLSVFSYAVLESLPGTLNFRYPFYSGGDPVPERSYENEIPFCVQRTVCLSGCVFAHGGGEPGRMSCEPSGRTHHPCISRCETHRRSHFGADDLDSRFRHPVFPQPASAACSGLEGPWQYRRIEEGRPFFWKGTGANRPDVDSHFRFL